MDHKPDQSLRDRAIQIVRVVTFGGIGGALGLTWIFANLADAYFSGKPPKPPVIPAHAAPVQKAPPVVTTVVHHPYQPGTTSTTGPRPPSQIPAAPPPPPAPACVSTPSRPC